MNRRTDDYEPGASNLAQFATADPLRGAPDVAMVGLMAVHIIVGYEWFVSGLAKFVRGGFPSGLADELAEKSPGAADWYVSFGKLPYRVDSVA